jgi:glucarate dehydratase
MKYMGGKIKLPSSPGLGVELDYDKMKQYSELFKELGGYKYDRDPGRPDWYTVMPEKNYADPNIDMEM